MPLGNRSKDIPDPEDRRQHLDFIQAVVTRMSAASSTTKGWLLPVVTVTYGYALVNRDASVAMLGVAAVLLFAVIDANYLNQERAFRRLYDAVAQGGKIPAFSMDASLAAPARPHPAIDSASRWKRMSRVVRGWFPAWAVWSSWAIAPLYGSLLFVGLVIILRVR